MATDKELLKAFREQFNTGGLFTESNVLVLMGYARSDERCEIKDVRKLKIPFQCPYKSEGFPCPYVDTLGPTQTKQCYECENFS